MLVSGCSSELMRLTIQLKRRPYRALDMASLTSVALSTVLVRMIVSPRVTTQWEVKASWSSSEPILSRSAAEHRQKNIMNGPMPLIFCLSKFNLFLTHPWDYVLIYLITRMWVLLMQTQKLTFMKYNISERFKMPNTKGINKESIFKANSHWTYQRWPMATDTLCPISL